MHICVYVCVISFSIVSHSFVSDCSHISCLAIVMATVHFGPKTLWTNKIRTEVSGHLKLIT